MKCLAVLAALLCMFFPASARAGTSMEYRDGDTVLEGYMARAKVSGRPVVLIVHQWKGLGEYEKRRADMLAEAGYNAFAIDMYGKGIRPQTNEEAGKLAAKYKGDPALSVQRMNAALNLIRSMSSVGPEIAIIGYCFGGTMALELARSGADIKAAVSFHGGLATPDPVARPGVIKASLQVHHGADDSNVPAKDVEAFQKEMKDADADLVFIAYSNAVHGFTEKEVGNDNSKGVAYNEKADKRSWAYTMDFLKGSFGR